MKKAVLFLAVAIWPILAFAQSSPNLQTRQVPSAADWKSYFAGKADTNNGTISNGTLISPTITGGSSSGGSGAFTTLGASEAADLSGGGSLGGGWTLTGSLSGIGQAGVTPTGGSTSRSLSDVNADAINILSMGVGGASVNRTGTTDASGAIQAAISLACGLSPIKAVYQPVGVYKISSRILIPGGCDGLTVRADQGAVWQLDPASNGNNAILSIKQAADHSLLSNITIQNLTFDGSVSSTANNNALFGLTWPVAGLSCLHCTFRNSRGTALVAAGEQPLTGSLNAQANVGQAVLSFTSTPTNVRAGSMVVGSACLDPDMYVVSTTATTVTLNRNLPDTCLSGTAIQFTRAFTTSADALYGATSLSSSNTSGLSVGETVWTSSGSCLQENTRIVSISGNVSVTVDRSVQCKIPSGTNVAAAGGNSNITVSDSTFSDIGQPNIAGATSSFTTNGTSSLGTTLTLNCLTPNCSRGAVIPGQTTGASSPSGVPASDIVLDVSVNTGTGVETVTLQNPLIGTITNGTSIPFNTSLGGVGYGIWHSWGAPFANRGDKFTGNRFVHTWAAPMYMVSTENALFQGNTCVEDQMEFRDPTIAPSPCLNVEATIGSVVNGEVYSGSTGSGIEAEHPVRLKIIQADTSRHAGNGVSISGGHDNEVLGLIANNNCQYLNTSYVQDIETNFKACSGLNIGGSATAGQVGTASNLLVTGVLASDTQASPTQKYGIRRTGSGSMFVDLNMGSFSGVGNTTALLDPALGPSVSACGTSPTISSGATDKSGVITEGASSAGCTITFASAKSAAPICNISPGSAAANVALLNFSVSTTAMTITNLTASGNSYGYTCSQ